MRTVAVILIGVFALAPSAAQPASAQVCPGDCGADLVVTIDELITCVNIGLGTAGVDACAACDADGGGDVAINELVRAVASLLNGCPNIVPLPGTCRRPNASGSGPCAAGSKVIVYKCVERGGCLDSLVARRRLGEAEVDANGRFSVLVDGREASAGLLMFEAEVEDATIFRALDLGSATSAAAHAGGVAGVAATVVDAASEASVRLIDEIGLEYFSDAGVLEVAATVRVATAGLDLAGLSADEAADLATATAREDPQVQAALRRNATPTHTATAAPTAQATHTATRSASATASFSRTPTASATATSSATAPVATPTASPTPSATLPPIFGPAQQLDAGDRPSAVVVADLNADQLPDVVVANADSFDISVWLGLSGGGLSDRQDFPVGAGTFPVALVVAYLNDDDVLDIATADSFTDQVSVLLGTGGGAFGSPTRYEVGVTPSAIAAGQLGGDARADLVTANRNFESTSVLFANQSGYATHELLTVGASPAAVLVLDLDADGSLDLVTANLDSDDLSVLRGTGGGTFAPQQRFAAGNGPAALAVANLDGNDVDDLAVANADAGEVAVFLRGESGIALPEPQRFATGDGPLALAIADLDGDGANDLVTANAVSEDVSVLFGNGAGGFAAERRVLVGGQPVSVAVADVTGDGSPDVLTANRSGDYLTVLPGLPDAP